MLKNVKKVMLALLFAALLLPFIAPASLRTHATDIMSGDLSIQCEDECCLLSEGNYLFLTSSPFFTDDELLQIVLDAIADENGRNDLPSHRVYFLDYTPNDYYVNFVENDFCPDFIKNILLDWRNNYYNAMTNSDGYMTFHLNDFINNRGVEGQIICNDVIIDIWLAASNIHAATNQCVCNTRMFVAMERSHLRNILGYCFSVSQRTVTMCVHCTTIFVSPWIVTAGCGLGCTA
ncbi:MAG: hypothetical protein FWC71_09375 [Defluviitaleaceae bacterium]|nr:hypothetical protein [Defluviitaleaceae bacterium]